MMNMTDKEVGWVAAHLGHTKGTHFSHYRKHENIIEIAKIGKLLLASEMGILKQFEGKTLEDINLEGRFQNLITSMKFIKSISS